MYGTSRWCLGRASPPISCFVSNSQLRRWEVLGSLALSINPRMIFMTMRAARFYDQKDIRIEDIARPTAGPDDVLIDIAWCGICGTDIHEYQDGPIFIPPKGSPHPVTGEEAPITLGH